jgi:uncharacterized protein (TIGR00290 family)
VKPDSRRSRRGPRAPRAVLSWSTGKDAAHSLHRLRQDGTYNVVALLTTVVSGTDRVATHGVRQELLVRQTKATGLPLTRVVLPPSPSNVVYEEAMARALRGFLQRGIRHVVFGDLFLEDIRRFRERQLAELGMNGVFPLWGLDTHRLAEEMIETGLRARVVSVDPRRIPASWAGRPFDRRWLEELPPGVDPCGENGEFHTFVTAGPVLRRSVPVRIQGREVRDGAATVDLRLRPPNRRRPAR